MRLLPLTLLLLGAAAGQVTPLCAVTVSPQVTRGVTYHASIRLAPGCPPGGTARVRKSSTLNTRASGAPYQPIKPEQGAWTVTRTGSTVPIPELWTLFTWQWQFYDPQAWNVRTQEFGVWKRALPPGVRP